MFEPMIGTIVLGSPEWLWPIVGAGLVVAVILVVSYEATSLSSPIKFLLTALKVTGLVLIGLCLLNPMWSENQLRPGENIVAILVDNSASMQIQNQDDSQRGESVSRLLGDDHKEWLTRLHQDFDLRRYLFGDQMRQVEDFSELDFSDSRSHLLAGLDALGQRFQNQPLAAVLVLSDGNASDPEELVNSDLQVPVYPVISRKWSKSGFDIAIERVSVSETPFEDAPITVVATVSSTSNKPQKVVAKLFRDNALGSTSPGESGEDGNELEPGDDVETPPRNVSETATINPGESTSIRLQLRPAHLGVGFYRLQIVPEKEQDAFENQDASTEATLVNNERLIAIDRGSGNKRVLYVGGRPSWEYKFFNRALAEDRGVDLVAILRIARKEAKFDFRGRVGENSNSLFRGFDDDADEETESYDQAVIKRLNTRDADELRGGFPKTKEELYEYHAVILDDVEAKFFSHDQQILLDRFVSERGGGLLMLGGRDSFRHGDWHKSSLRDAFPVYLDRGSDPPKREMVWSLTRDGWLEPWMRVRSTEDEEKRRLKEVPPIKIVNPLVETKPGARVFSEVDDGAGTRFPAVVAHQYGQGRSVAVLIGDLWRWSLSRPDPTDDDLAQTWRQLVRWMIADVPLRVETAVESVQLGFTPAMKLSVHVRNQEFQAEENATVDLSIKTPSGEVIELDAEPSLEEVGRFEATYVPRESGAYLATVTAGNDQNELPQTMKLGWTSEPARTEFKAVDVNSNLLEEIAKSSGGEVIEFDGLESFVTSLPQRKMPVTQVKTTPLWHTPWIILFALGCLAAEWGIRRQRGLP